MTGASVNLTFLIDLIMLSALAFTIFYAIRLSGQLKILKQSKSDLEQLISNLSININRAQEAIQEMHDVANDSGTNLQNLISSSENLSQELQIILNAGENIAERLEKATSENGEKLNEVKRAAQAYDTDANSFQDYDEDEYITNELNSAPSNSNAANTINSPFFIRDKEFEEPKAKAKDTKRSAFYDELDNIDDDEDNDDFEKFSSYAEKHLAMALKNKQH